MVLYSKTWVTFAAMITTGDGTCVEYEYVQNGMTVCYPNELVDLGTLEGGTTPACLLSDIGDPTFEADCAERVVHGTEVGCDPPGETPAQCMWAPAGSIREDGVAACETACLDRSDCVAIAWDVTVAGCYMITGDCLESYADTTGTTEVRSRDCMETATPAPGPSGDNQCTADYHFCMDNGGAAGGAPGSDCCDVDLDCGCHPGHCGGSCWDGDTKKPEIPTETMCAGFEWRSYATRETEERAPGAPGDCSYALNSPESIDTCAPEYNFCPDAGAAAGGADGSDCCDIDADCACHPGHCGGGKEARELTERAPGAVGDCSYAINAGGVDHRAVAASDVCEPEYNFCPLKGEMAGGSPGSDCCDIDADCACDPGHCGGGKRFRDQYEDAPGAPGDCSYAIHAGGVDHRGNDDDALDDVGMIILIVFIILTIFGTIVGVLICWCLGSCCFSRSAAQPVVVRYAPQPARQPESLMVCPHCAATIQIGRFCARCGEPVSQQPAAQPPVYQQALAPQPVYQRPVAQAAPSGLPAGWASAADPSSGNTYYYHTDGRTSWSEPDGPLATY